MPSSTLRLAVCGAGLGVLVTLAGLGWTKTSNEDAIERTQALVPPGADAPPVGVIEPRFGGIYTITQEFSGGASGRDELAAAMLTHLDSLGWHVNSVEELDGATAVMATSGDLVSLSRLRGPPTTPTVEGILQVRFASRNEFLVLGLAALLGAAAGTGVAFLRPPETTRIT